MREVKSSIVHQSSYTLVANPKRWAEAQRVREECTRLNRERTDAILKKAAGTPIVRESSFCGPCRWLGLLIRETPKFYIYAERCLDLGQSLAAEQKRISKSKVHLTACCGCEDHPQTYYPIGYEN